METVFHLQTKHSIKDRSIITLRHPAWTSHSHHQRSSSNSNNYNNSTSSVDLVTRVKWWLIRPWAWPCSSCPDWWTKDARYSIVRSTSTWRRRASSTTFRSTHPTWCASWSASSSPSPTRQVVARLRIKTLVVALENSQVPFLWFALCVLSWNITRLWWSIGADDWVAKIELMRVVFYSNVHFKSFFAII